jgi:APA family basic amino acid/polyamine antiporter
MRAKAVVLPLPQRSGGGTLFGRTLETVLTERPCRIIIESQPGGRPAPMPVPGQPAPARV